MVHETRVPGAPTQAGGSHRHGRGLSQSQSAALARIQTALVAGHHLICLTGASGVGKSAIATALVDTPPPGVDVLHQGFWWRGTDAVAHFEGVLAARSAAPAPHQAAPRSILLICDAADSLDTDTLGRFAAYLRRQDPGASPAMQGLVIGAGDVAHRLRQIAPEVGPDATIELGPFSREEADAFVRDRVASRGIGPAQLGDVQLRALYAQTSGNPRRLKALVEKSFLSGRMGGPTAAARPEPVKPASTGQEAAAAADPPSKSAAPVPETGQPRAPAKPVAAMHDRTADSGRQNAAQRVDPPPIQLPPMGVGEPEQPPPSAVRAPATEPEPADRRETPPTVVLPFQNRARHPDTPATVTEAPLRAAAPRSSGVAWRLLAASVAVIALGWGAAYIAVGWSQTPVAQAPAQQPATQTPALAASLKPGPSRLPTLQTAPPQEASPGPGYKRVQAPGPLLDTAEAAPPRRYFEVVSLSGVPQPGGLWPAPIRKEEPATEAVPSSITRPEILREPSLGTALEPTRELALEPTREPALEPARELAPKTGPDAVRKTIRTAPGPGSERDLAAQKTRPDAVAPDEAAFDSPRANRIAADPDLAERSATPAPDPTLAKPETPPQAHLSERDRSAPAAPDPTQDLLADAILRLAEREALEDGLGPVLPDAIRAQLAEIMTLHPQSAAAERLRAAGFDPAPRALAFPITPVLAAAPIPPAAAPKPRAIERGPKKPGLKSRLILPDPWTPVLRAPAAQQAAPSLAARLNTATLAQMLGDGLMGNVVQPRAPAYAVLIRREGVRVLFSYPQHGCRGVLEPAAIAQDGMVYRERLFPDRGCVNAGWVRLVPLDAGEVGYGWAATRDGPWYTHAVLTVPPREDGTPMPWHHLPDLASIDPELQEALLALVRRDRREIQQRLKIAGYDPKGVDGLFGPATRAALAAWQEAHGYAVTGYIDAEQQERLRVETADRYVAPARRNASPAERLVSAIRRNTRTVEDRHCLRDLNGRALRGYQVRCAVEEGNPDADR
ncbi:MAG: peptidoglycan-binding protein [Pseudomonadota bacterium]